MPCVLNFATLKQVTKLTNALFTETDLTKAMLNYLNVWNLRVVQMLI